MVANDEAGLALGELCVKNTVQSTGFVDISIDAILDLLRSVSVEVVCLTLHGAETYPFHASVDEHAGGKE